MAHHMDKSPYSYVDLIGDIIRERSVERGVRAHDLKLQALRSRPTMKRGTWGTRPDGSAMTREEYEGLLAEYLKRLPDLLFPPVDTEFTLKDNDGNIATMADLAARKQQGMLTFPSSIVSSITANNTACALVYPAAGKKAVVILPNLRAQEGAFSRLAGLLSRFGYTCVEAVHPYHGRRHDPNDTEMVPGERLFSSNVHETLWSFSQGISDILALYLFLINEGYTRIGVIGTSIGSTLTIMSLANAEDYRAYLERRDPDLVRDIPYGICRAVVLNLSGGLLSDFIMDADNIEASYVRKGLVDDLGLSGPDIEHIWPEADPLRFVRRITMPVLSVKSKQDPVLLYRYSSRQREFFARNAVGGKNFTEFYIPVPSGHYSASYFPPKIFLGIADLLFILRHV